jgi:hypothetical protein
MAEDQVARRGAAGDRRQHEGLVDRLGHRLRLQPLERRRDRQRQRQRRQRQVAGDVCQPRRPAGPERVDRRHAAERQPPGARRHEHQQQRRQQRRQRQTHQRGAAHDHRQHAAAAASGVDAERDPDERRHDQRDHRQHGGVRAGTRQQLPDRAVVDERVAEVEA